MIQSDAGEPFLVARGRELGQQIVMAPAFLKQEGLTGLLRDAIKGQVTPAGKTMETTVHHPAIGHLTLIYRISHIAIAECEDGTSPDPQDRPLVEEELLRDDSGRPIKLAYGLVYRSKPNRVPEHEAEPLSTARTKAISAYRDFLHDEASETKSFQQPPPEQEVTRSPAQSVPADEPTAAEDPVHPTFGDVKNAFAEACRTLFTWLGGPP
jgi:hypothetical protein